MIKTRTLLIAAGLVGLCGATSAIALRNPDPSAPAQVRLTQPPSTDKKSDKTLQMAVGIVRSVDTGKNLVTLTDGRVLHLHVKTMVFKGQDKVSIYSVSSGQAIEFALDHGADEVLGKQARKSVAEMSTQRADSKSKDAQFLARIALLRIIPKNEKTR